MNENQQRGNSEDFRRPIRTPARYVALRVVSGVCLVSGLVFGLVFGLVSGLVFGLACGPVGCERHQAPPTPQPSAAVPKALAGDSAKTPAGDPNAAPPAASAHATTDQPAPAWPSGEVPLAMPDRGIFPDLDDEVRLTLPSWLSEKPTVVVEVAHPPGRFVVVDGMAIGFAPEAWPSTFRVADLKGGDQDGDGIPDSLDILIGAKKAVLNGARYRSTYRVIPYPGGDMPRTEGVCTDVVVRALRNAGFDLQKEIQEDAKLKRSAYPGMVKPDRNIDHRRVRNLFPFFKRHWVSLPVDPRDRTSPWLPGDIVFLDTMNGPQPEHLGVVSDRLAASGLPLIVNNWTDGTKTAEMDLLDFVPVRGRFRVPARALGRK